MKKLPEQQLPLALYPSENAVLKSKDIRKLLGNISRSTFYRMLKNKQFPIQHGWCGRSRYWLISQYHEWLKVR